MTTVRGSVSPNEPQYDEARLTGEVRGEAVPPHEGAAFPRAIDARDIAPPVRDEGQTAALVRILGRESSLAEISQNLDDLPARVFMVGPTNDDFEATPVSWVRLPEGAVAQVRNRTIDILTGRLVKQREGESFETAFARASKAYNEGNQRNEDWVDLRRLTETVLDEGMLEAFVDPGSDRIVIRERITPLPEGIQSKIDPPRAKNVLDTMMDQCTDPEMKTVIVNAIADCVPLDAIRLLHRTGTRIRVCATSEELMVSSDKERAMFGDAWCALHARVFRRPMTGYQNPDANTIEFGPLRTNSRPVMRTCAVHEAMHALSQALGTNGKQLSDLPEFQNIHDATLEDTTGELHLPWGYARIREECSAIAGTILLTSNVVSFPLSDVVRTREFLKDTNRPLYDFMEHLFTERVPAKLSEFRDYSPEDWRNRNIALAREALSLHQKMLHDDPSTDNVLRVAAQHGRLAILGDTTASFDQGVRELESLASGIPRDDTESRLLIQNLADELRNRPDPT